MPDERVVLESTASPTGTSSMSLDDTVDEVAKAAKRDDANGREMAKRFLKRALSEYVRDLNLRISGKESATATLAAGEDRVAIPDDLDEIQYVQMKSPVIAKLFHLDKNVFVEKTTNADDMPGQPHWYTDFDTGQTGEIAVWPVPQESTDVVIGYTAVPSLPTTGAGRYALPDKYMIGVLALAKGMMLLDCGADANRAQMYLSEGRAAKRLSDRDDKARPDNPVGFRPGYTYGGYGGYGHPRTSL